MSVEREREKQLWMWGRTVDVGLISVGVDVGCGRGTSMWGWGGESFGYILSRTYNFSLFFLLLVLQSGQELRPSHMSTDLYDVQYSEELKGE